MVALVLMALTVLAFASVAAAERGNIGGLSVGPVAGQE
jgi:hypothetical protein